MVLFGGLYELRIELFAPWTENKKSNQVLEQKIKRN
jgi:hypothetical protein